METHGATGQLTQPKIGCDAAPREDEHYCEFIRREVGGVDFNDRRLSARFQQVMADFAARPSGSIPFACGDWARTKGAYRLFSNDAVTAEAILEPHFEQTLRRCEGEEVVLAIGDTTYIDLTGLDSVPELGPLASQNRRGFVVQPTLVVTPQRAALGLIDSHVWARDPKEFGKRAERCNLPIEKKESFKWLRSIDAATNLQKKLAEKKVHVAAVFDREGDIYDVLAKAVALDHRPDLIVRSIHDRSLEDADDQKLWTFVNAQPSMGALALSVPRKHQQKAREAILRIQFTEVTLRPPKRPKTETPLAPLRVWAVSASEDKAPSGVTPIDWRILTTIPVESHEAAKRVLGWYACRWTIEQYFKVLKSGCEAEERRLEADVRIRNCLAADMIIAWMILYLTTIGRETPDLPCTVIFDEDAWKAVWIYIHRSTDLPSAIPTLNEMTRMIGRLGGHLGRSRDGPPGSETLWKGLERIPDLVGMWQIVRPDQ